ncbi:hypothetical protein BJ170DRAFT_639582 [Xylariales sp. AK1849]|nr:hypothetical protein BJ170DRAFT_639582 [Xylariales sp. AK1849]
MWPMTISPALVVVLQFAFGLCESPSRETDYEGNEQGNIREGRVVGLERLLPIPVSTWTSFITITLTTTLDHWPTGPPPQLPTTSDTPVQVAVPTSTPSAVSTTAIPTISSTESPIRLPSGLTSSSEGIPSNTQPTIASSSSTSEIVPASTSTIVSSISSSSSTSALSTSSSFAFSSNTSSFPAQASGSMVVIVSATAATSTATAIASTPFSTTSSATVGEPPLPPFMPAPDHLLDPSQITAIVAAIISSTVFIIIVAILLRCCVIRRRQRGTMQRQSLDTGPMAQVDPDPGSAYSYDTGSQQRKEIRIVIQPSISSQLNQDLWPSPPGHTERYTFFSGRSTTTEGEATTTDRGQWSVGTEAGSSSQHRSAR